QGIGNVGRLRQFRQAQLSLDGVLHLFLAGVAVAGNGLFDPRGSVADYWQLMLGGGQKDHAASMSHQDRRPWMVVVGEELLQRNRLRVILFHNLYYTIVQGTEARGEVSCLASFGGFDDASLAD